jgi:uncharacterized protein (TIGR02646 family)
MQPPRATGATLGNRHQPVRFRPVLTVDRPSVRAPASLDSRRVADARFAAATHFRASDARARQSLHRFEPLYTARDVRDALSELFSNKCGFCESPLGGALAGDVHHFRPKQGAVDPRDGDTSRRHYWWLAYEWENLYLACGRCIRSAGARFPVDGQRARGGATGVALRDERPLLLDPCMDDPDVSLLFQLDGTIVAGDTRGALTIETFSLNRPTLVNARLDRIRSIQDWLQQGVVDSDDVVDRSAPYAGMARQLIGALTAGAELPPLEPPKAPGAFARPFDHSAAVRIVRVEIINFRAIDSLELEFQSEPDSWTMLLGENGDGKSSVLQAIAVALMSGSQRSRLDSAPYLRHGARPVAEAQRERTGLDGAHAGRGNGHPAQRRPPGAQAAGRRRPPR